MPASLCQLNGLISAIGNAVLETGTALNDLRLVARSQSPAAFAPIDCP